MLYCFRRLESQNQRWYFEYVHNLASVYETISVIISYLKFAIFLTHIVQLVVFERHIKSLNESDDSTSKFFTGSLTRNYLVLQIMRFKT